MRIIANIRGCNGSGKSSIPMSMLDDPDMFVIYKPYKGRDKGIATVFPNYGWIALGTYFNKTGGLDGFPNKAFTEKVFWYILKHYPEYNILLKGAVASTYYGPYIEMFKAAQQKYPSHRIWVCSLIPSYKICLKRVLHRNGGKPINEQRLLHRYNYVVSSHQKFVDAGIHAFTWDNKGAKKKQVKLIAQLEQRILDEELLLDDELPF